VRRERPKYFFDQPQHELPQGPSPSDYVTELLASSEGVVLMRAFQRLPNEKVRRRILALVQELAEHNAGPVGSLA
jgi:hypothetical protein